MGKFFVDRDDGKGRRKTINTRDDNEGLAVDNDDITGDSDLRKGVKLDRMEWVTCLSSTTVTDEDELEGGDDLLSHDDEM
jgi:hypothetical protein